MRLSSAHMILWKDCPKSSPPPRPLGSWMQGLESRETGKKYVIHSPEGMVTDKGDATSSNLELFWREGMARYVDE